MTATQAAVYFCSVSVPSFYSFGMPPAQRLTNHRRAVFKICVCACCTRLQFSCCNVSCDPSKGVILPWKNSYDVRRYHEQACKTIKEARQQLCCMPCMMHTDQETTGY